jgi:hypothetical protein
MENKPKYPTAPQLLKVLKTLLDADGQWVSKEYFYRPLGLTQPGARIKELETPIGLGGYGWPIEHSEHTDEHGFKYLRIIQETTTMPLLIVPGYTQVNTKVSSSTPYDD